MAKKDRNGLYVFEDGEGAYRRAAKPENIEAAREKLARYIEKESPSPAAILEMLARAWARAEELTEECTELSGRLGGYKMYLMSLAGRVRQNDNEHLPFDLFEKIMRGVADDDETVALMLDAAEHVEMTARKKTAAKGAAAKLANDPTQAAKVEAKYLWKDWQEGRTRHKSGAAFARFVVSKLQAIESEDSVRRWAREWAKATKNKP